MLTTAQKSAYAQDGYLLLHDVISPQLVEEIHHELHRFGARVPGTVSINDEEIWGDPTIPDGALLQTIPQRLLALPTVIEPVQELLGADSQMFVSTPLLVRASRGQVYWHRDFDYAFEYLVSESHAPDLLTDLDTQSLHPQALGIEDFVVIALFLQDTSEALGPMRVIPGSHRWEHAPTQSQAEALPTAVHLPVPAGTAVVYASCVWHSLGRNTSSTDCWIFALGFRPQNLGPMFEALQRQS